jgi:hypothetical protein
MPAGWFKALERKAPVVYLQVIDLNRENSRDSDSSDVSKSHGNDNKFSGSQFDSWGVLKR